MKFLFSVILVIISFLGISKIVNGQIACPSPFLYRATNDTVGDYDLGYQYINIGKPLPPQLSFLNNCLMPCQSSFFEQDSWNSFNKLVKQMGAVAFTCSAIIMIIYGPLMNRSFFKFDRHTITVFCFALSTFFIGVSDLMFATNDVDMVCPESHRYARQTDKTCATNGVLFQFGWLGSVMWFAFLSIDGFFRASGKKMNKIAFAIVLASIWILNIVLSFAPMGGDQYGAYFVGQVNCWILVKNWQYAFFWAELIVSLAIGFVGICLTIYSLIRKTSDGNTLKHVTPLILVFLLFCQYLYMIIFYGIINEKKDHYQNILAEQVGCIFNNALAKMKVPGIVYAGECTFNETITFSSQYAFLFFVRLLGIEIFAFYLFSKETLLLIKSSYIATMFGLGDKDAYDVELEETD
ncbi:G-protein-coupled receptor family protein [Dictyostelium discoideum AX4]|uniref:Frizzled/smoothened-like sans CRD protein J n=1 Tax=Dictyostelium discoideum TaxID=44689 RepID=FSCJ_DICDI|nr:G-protein-coupled receptor family protein [Dictyostelium discoideum AX4]Q54DP2.1 RecName: Full=Frizzled/smoothened-like sans CRD protein J; Flags: Precursor [Dictyostelium discoideum]EAL61407.1 G-protein-coupled receptor family protein [Dictyostelium discoideum AX4]|eukprot:XP_629830.1 G-protein-coupled receptor family protein [Dictyostelium discoideum AX4]